MHRHKRRPAGRVARIEHRTDRVAVSLLGGFEVSVDGTITHEACWRRRTAASLVKVLALAPGHRLHREQVIDLLWPDESPAEAAPKLHKAAHYARRAVGRDDAVVLRNDVVQLFPGTELIVDVVEFDDLSRRALASSDPSAAREAIEHYGGELLPDDRYEDWAEERRELLRMRHLNLLRLAGQWFELSELEPGDEEAHVEVMRDQVANGDGDAALLQYDRLERVLDRDFGIAPGPAARGLRAAAQASPSACLSLDQVVAELAELTRRQAFLLESLAASERECASC
jgi:DNA-binding SARP family transcriptional activator